MKEIEKWFKNNLNDCVMTQFCGELHVSTPRIIYTVSAPHSGNDYRWLLRVSTVAAFDRWANSTAVEEFFETKEEVVRCLNNQPWIYKQLIEYLSKEYEEMEELYNEEEL